MHRVYVVVNAQRFSIAAPLLLAAPAQETNARKECDVLVLLESAKETLT